MLGFALTYIFPEAKHVQTIFPRSRGDFLIVPSKNLAASQHSPFPHSKMLCPQALLLLLLAFFSLSLSTAAYSPPSLTPESALLLPSDAVALLSFKSKADRDNKLLYAINERFDYCQWQGVKCVQGRVVRFVLQSFGLRGVFPANTLNRLDQLRLLSLQNNSLSGPIPDLSGLFNLKSLFLDRNSFTGSFPLSVLSLHRLRTLDLSYNNLTGLIPVGLTTLDRLNSLRLEVNRFNGTVPPLNQSALQIFNVSGNNLTGAIPVTPTLRHFDTSSFMRNPNLCGEIINVACSLHSPFFGSSNATSMPAPVDQNGQSQNVVLPPPACSKKNNSRIGVVLGFAIGVLVLIAGILCFFALVRTRTRSQTQTTQQTSMPMPTPKSSSNLAASAALESQAEQNNELPVQVKATKDEEMHRVQKSGNLVFCGGEAQLYTLEQLMRGSAELLGRGTIGTTYKAVLDNQLIMTVKRLDGNKTAVTNAEVFHKHMDAVGGLRHPNLVPIRAYFQAKGERLIIYDYQPNGSLFSLIHGSRSARAKPLHWTSCLKIAEDVGQGLAYIHQASRLIHGNLKSSNVLLGADFEACLTDYCLAVLADSSSSDDPDSASYKAPETRKSSRRATSKSDVYTFGVLLLELLTGKSPSQHPFLVPTDMPDWVRAMRESEDGGEGNQLGMLVEVAGVCRLASPEQRPEMWQVLKMIQEIKESVMIEDNASVG